MHMESAEVTWDQCLSIIKDNISYQKFKSWFEPIRAISLVDNTLTIQVPSQFWYEWLEEHYYTMLRSTLSKVMGEHGKLEYSVVMEKSDQYEHNKSIRLPQRPMPPAQDQHVQSYPDYSPDRIENPFVIPGIRKTKIDSNLNGSYANILDEVRMSHVNVALPLAVENCSPCCNTNIYEYRNVD